MKKRLHGPSLYYATDKNIFDALTQHKVDTPTVLKLFQRRNIIVGKRVPREDLAKYFSQLTHDFYDHKDIAARLGVAPRRERTTSMDILGVEETEDLQGAIEQLKQELEATGDVIQVSQDGDSITVNVQYSTVDYKRSEFSQVQVRDGTVQFVRSGSGFIVRSTQNEYMNDVRDTLLAKVDKAVEKPVSRVVVSLFDVPSPRLRSKFFHELMTNLPGFVRRDVTDVYVYKAKPEPDDDSDESLNDTSDDDSGDPDTHVERVFLRGNGITRSQLLNALLDEEDYYIVKVGWTATESSVKVTRSRSKQCSQITQTAAASRFFFTVCFLWKMESFQSGAVRP